VKNYKKAVAVLICGLLLGASVNVFAAEKEITYVETIQQDNVSRNGSDYIAGYDGWLYSGTSNQIVSKSELNVLGAAGRITATLQHLDNGVWKSVVMYTDNDADGVCGLAGTYKNAVSGDWYRLNCKFDAIINGSVVETRDYKSTEILAK